MEASGIAVTYGNGASEKGYWASGTTGDGDTYLRNNASHEIAHLLGRPHAVDKIKFGGDVSKGKAYGACGEEADYFADTFPYFEPVKLGGLSKAVLGPASDGDNKKIYGWDSLRNQVVDPLVNFELMSYCGFKEDKFSWVSKYTYEKLKDAIDERFGTMSEPALSISTASVKTYTVFRGLIDLNKPSATFKPILTLESDTPPPAMNLGSYNLVLWDANNNVLNTIPFDPIKMEETTTAPGSGNSSVVNTGMFLIPMELNSAAIKAIVTLNDVQIGATHASNHAPTVTMIFPNGGETLNPPRIVAQWQAADVDGDPLTYMIQFSSDGGATWKALSSGYSNNGMTITLNDLGQTNQGKLRVQVSDGWNTAQDETDGTFLIPNLSPSCDIHLPVNNTLYVGTQPIHFEAITRDSEDGAVGIVQWASNLNGNLGIGNQLAIAADQLIEGDHAITVSCSDSGNLTDTAQVAIRVRRVVPKTKGDANYDGIINQDDLDIISGNIGKTVAASSCGEVCDMNDDGFIKALDLRLARLAMGILVVDTPNGEDIWNEGGKQTITWTSQNIDRKESLLIYLSTDNGLNWKKIASAKNTGSKIWTIPVKRYISKQALIKICKNQNSPVCDSSDAVFTINKAPVAEAGVRQTVIVGTEAVLNGGASYDLDNSPSAITYSWIKKSGPAATLTGAYTATPSFTPTLKGTYVFGLVVNDGSANSKQDKVIVNVKAEPVIRYR